MAKGTGSAVAGSATGRTAAPTKRPSLYARTPWWVRVLVVFAASRIISTVILLAFAAVQQQNPWTSASPDYYTFAGIWDGNWYHIVSAVGYPSALPMTAEGHVGESAWAFMPVYPTIVGFLVYFTGLPFNVMAVVVSMAATLGAALIFYRLVALKLPEGTALFSVVVFLVAPLSPILQVAYAESLGLLLLVLALYLLVQRKYWVMLPVVAAMALTRPTGLAFALAMLLHVIYRFATRRRDPYPRREIVASASVAVFSGIMGLVWPVAAWIATGSMTAYTDTELAWRSAYIGYGDLVPFAAWIQGATWWSGMWGIPAGVGLVLLAALVGLFATALFIPPVRRLGVDLRFWMASYGLYLLAIFFPQSSTFRLLMPMFPFAAAIAQPKSIIYRTLVVVVAIAGQVGWVYIAWWVDGSDWTPP